MARVFIIHKWEGEPTDDWYPWLRGALGSRGIEAHVLAMPNSDEPKIEEWVPYLAEKVGRADAETYLVGHSIGCQAILRYLENASGKIGGALLVAGWITLKDDALSEKEWEVAQPWCKTPINWAKVKRNGGHITLVLARNDPYVSLENAELFERLLGAKVLIRPSGAHFEKEDGFLELHVALNELLKMTRGSA